MNGGNGHKSLRDQLLAVPLRRKEVRIEGYPPLYVRELSAADRWAYEEHFLGPKSEAELPEAEVERAKKRLLAALVSQYLVDDSGERLFGDEEAEIDLMERSLSLEVLLYLRDECLSFFQWPARALEGAKEELTASPFGS
jgi:hypothetical protein